MDSLYKKTDGECVKLPLEAQLSSELFVFPPLRLDSQPPPFPCGFPQQKKEENENYYQAASDL